MVELVSKLVRWSTDYLEGTEQFLVDVENKPGSSKYKIYIDGIEPLTIKQCAMLSRHLSKQIEEDPEIDEEDYFTFEVSSPGADKPLKLIRQFYKHIGRELAVETLEGKMTKGILKGVENDVLTLLVQVSKKEQVEEKIDFRNVKEANVIISFK